MEERGNGRLSSQIKLPPSHSPPSASVAKLKLQIGSMKPTNTENTTQLEKKKKGDRRIASLAATARLASTPAAALPRGNAGASEVVTVGMCSSAATVFP